MAPENFDWLPLSKLLAGYYKKRAEVSVKLFEVSKQISIQHEEIIENFAEVKEMLQKNIIEEHRIEMNREYVFRRFIQSKVNSFIADMLNYTYYFIFKKGIQFENNENPTKCIFRNLKERKKQLNVYIDEFFWREPIHVITINPKGGIEPLEKDILPTQFIKEAFITKIQRQIELLLNYKEILPDELYYTILAIDGEINSTYFKMVQQGFELMLNQTVADVKGLQFFINELCDIMLSLERFYVE